MYCGALADTPTICVPSSTESSPMVRLKKALVWPAVIVIEAGTVSSDKSVNLSATVTFEAAGAGSQTCPCSGSGSQDPERAQQCGEGQSECRELHRRRGCSSQRSNSRCCQ